jgi:predicted transcriptional regulator
MQLKHKKTLKGRAINRKGLQAMAKQLAQVEEQIENGAQDIKLMCHITQDGESTRDELDAMHCKVDEVLRRLKDGGKQGLLIRSEWLSLILQGKKTWELRSKATDVRGPIELIDVDKGQIMGTAWLKDCLRKTVSELKESASKKSHQVTDPKQLRQYLKGHKYGYAWVISEVMRYTKPRPYLHKRGCVKWVKLP